MGGHDEADRLEASYRLGLHGGGGMKGASHGVQDLEAIEEIKRAEAKMLKGEGDILANNQDNHIAGHLE